MSKKMKFKNVGFGDVEQHQNRQCNDVLSDDELKILSASRGEIDRSTLPHYDNSDLAVAKRYAKKNKLTVIFVSVTLLLVLAIIAVLSVLLIGKLADAPSKEDYEIHLGDEIYTVKYKKAVKDGVLYLDINKIARYADLVISGNKNALKISCDDGTYVRFTNGKDTAEVNGDTVRLEGTAYISTSGESSQEIECLIPFTFIEKLFSHQAVPGTVGLFVKKYDNANYVIMRRKIFAGSEQPIPIGFSADCFDIVIK